MPATPISAAAAEVTKHEKNVLLNAALSRTFEFLYASYVDWL